MHLVLPQIDQRDTYHRLATLYTVVFGAAAASFYLTLLQSGSDFNLALFAAVAAGLHYGLLRLAGATTFEAAPLDLKMRRFTPATVLAGTDLMTRLEQLRHETRSSHDEVGLMLISLATSESRDGAPSVEMVKLVRGELFRAADSRIFQVDERTMAVAEAQGDVVLHFDKISVELQRQLRAAQPRLAASAPRATIGVAVATGGRSSAEELMDGARAAIRLAESNHRDTYFRRVS
ncbi:MAG TPA: hypothetical protein VFS30_15690 [Dehalococcoidia bacterium]|nr:hypothetical protein [Dehalococcoidia bacterium]